MENEIIEVGRKGRFMYLSAHKDTTLRDLESFAGPHYKVDEGRMAVVKDDGNPDNFIWAMVKIRDFQPETVAERELQNRED